jgi:hypothetical protein
MTSKPLPENIDKIREAVDKELCLFCPHDDCLKRYDESICEVGEKARSAILSKLDELGVVKLAEDQTMPPIRRLQQGQADSDYLTKEEAFEDGGVTTQQDVKKAGFARVVSIVTGTPKEG